VGVIDRGEGREEMARAMCVSSKPNAVWDCRSGIEGSRTKGEGRAESNRWETTLGVVGCDCE